MSDIEHSRQTARFAAHTAYSSRIQVTRITGNSGLPADTRRWINVGLTLVQRRRRWTSVKPTLMQILESAGLFLFISDENTKARQTVV